MTVYVECWGNVGPDSPERVRCPGCKEITPFEYVAALMRESITAMDQAMATIRANTVEMREVLQEVAISEPGSHGSIPAPLSEMDTERI